ncbi:MAG: CHAT domain-containing protein [Bacteroidia bacterium]|nr:CHAT domain-containing protein [Bacteroidia bacterium]
MKKTINGQGINFVIFLFLLINCFDNSIKASNQYKSYYRKLETGNYREVHNFLVKRNLKFDNYIDNIKYHLLYAEFYYQINIIEQFKKHTDSANYFLIKSKTKDELIKAEILYNTARYYHFHAKPLDGLNFADEAIRLYNNNKKKFKSYKPYRYYLVKANLLRNYDRTKCQDLYDSAFNLVYQSQYSNSDLMEIHKSLGNFHLDFADNYKTDYKSHHKNAILHFNKALSLNLNQEEENRYVSSQIYALLALVYIKSEEYNKANFCFDSSQEKLNFQDSKSIYGIFKWMTLLNWRELIFTAKKENNVSHYKRQKTNELLLSMLDAWKEWHNLNRITNSGINHHIYSTSPYNILINNLIYKYSKTKSNELFDTILSLINDVKIIKPDYQNIARIINSKAPEVAKKLADNEAFITAFDNSSGISHFLVIHKKEKFIISIESDILHQAINKIFLDNFLMTKDFKTFKKNSYILYLNLWHKIQELLPTSINTIHIIPHREIGLINFDHLVTDTFNNTFKDLPYLIYRYKFNYHYSTKQFLERNKSIEEISALSIYSEYKDSNYYNLPFLVKLAKNNKIFSNTEKISDESNFFKTLQSPNIIQITGHYVQIPRRLSTNAYLALNTANEKPLQIKLSNFENNMYQSELVVLAMCDSYIGHLYSSEHIYSLPYILLKNGAKSCIFTMNKLEDQAGSNILSSLYENLAKGINKLDALHSAKIDNLKESKQDIEYHPMYWSSFQLMGNEKAVKINNQDKSIDAKLLITVITLSIILVLILIKVR